MLQCPILSNPLNGVVSFDERTVFSLATYSCNEGFFLIGPNVRECKSTGEWSVEIPVCQGNQAMTHDTMGCLRKLLL